MFASRYVHRFPLLHCRRSTVAIVVAMVAPVLAAAAGLGLEVSNWSVEKMHMQRAADLAALTGAMTYNNETSNNVSAATAAQDAANAAAALAEINNVPGPSSPAWNTSTQTLTDSNLKVQVVSNYQSSGQAAVTVNVTKTVPLTLSHIALSNSAVTISATSTAALEGSGSGASTGPQPCVFAMRTSADGGTGVGAGGYISVTAPGCTLRSNQNINFSGGGSFNTGGLYAAGEIDIPTWVTVSGGKYPNDGVLQDPYKSNTTLQNALTAASSTTGSNIACLNQQCGLPAGAANGTFNNSYCTGQGTGSVTCYLKPGHYGAWTALGGGPYTFNLSPGLYVFNGTIDLENNTTTNGTGVTIITTGAFVGKNTFNWNVTAPSSAQVASTGGITGVVLAGTVADVKSTDGTVTKPSLTLSGNPQFLADGVVYFPNGTFDASNSPTLGGSKNACLEILAANIKLSGSTYLNSNCSTLNVAGFGSNPGSTTYSAKLVQ